MGRPDVVLISDYLLPGQDRAPRSGVAPYTVQLASALAREGARVTVVGPAAADDDPTPARDGDVTLEHGPPPGVGALSGAVAMAQRLDAPVVHLQHEMFLFGGTASLVELPAALRHLHRGRAPVVVTLHQVVAPERVDREFVRRHRIRVPVALARAGLSIVQRLLVTAADVAVVHEQAFSKVIPTAMVIPHGLLAAPHPDRVLARRRLGMENEDRLVVLCFGYVAPYKGLEVALEAVTGLPQVKLVIAGAAHPRFESYARRLRERWSGVADFPGYIPEAEVPLWHAAADLALFCYPQPHASSGALTVALAHGTPFLVTEPLAVCMGTPAATRVAPEPRALARRLESVAADQRELDRLRSATYHMAAGRSWADVARRHLDLYRGLRDGVVDHERASVLASSTGGRHQLADE